MSDIVLDSKIEHLRNKYRGERVFLIGNGPSLDDTPLHKLTSEYSLAMNKINKIYPETEWRPSFYYATQSVSHAEAPYRGDCDYIQQNIDLGIQCFLRSDYCQYSSENVYHMNILNLHNTSFFDNLSCDTVNKVNISVLEEFWSENPLLVYHYHSMYGAIQLIKYMGFDQIYFLGCDLGFKYINPHMIFDIGMDPNRYQGGGYLSYLKTARENGTFGPSLLNGIAYKAIRNPHMNQFLNKFLSNSDSYFSTDYTEAFRIHDGHRINREITKSHIVAKRICESEGMSIYNATFGGELDVYERVDLETIL